MSYKSFDMLFMGDAGVETFNLIKHDIPHNVEVLKVGHHGGAGVVDSSMLEYLGIPVYIVNGSYTNIKITIKSDLDFAKLYI